VERLEISPNPVDDVLYIRSPQRAVHFKLANSLGQFVMVQQVAGQDIVWLTINQLHQGIYFLGAYDSHGTLIGQAKILKN
jgi:hypothetical protein